MQNLRLNLLTDEEVINLVLKHNYKAFKELVVRYSSDLFHFSYYFICDVEEVKKMVKSLFTDVWKKPYLYSKDFKISLYKKQISKIKKIKPEKKFATPSEKFLHSFKWSELLAINIYYFSNLNSDEIKLIYNNFEDTLQNIGKNYNINLHEFVSDISVDNIKLTGFQGEIVKAATSYRQWDKYQMKIIIISIIPLLILLFLIVYSAFAS